MLRIDRHAFILHQVNLHNKVLSTDLSKQLKVSDDTIRRDLQQLDEAGKIIRVHGGAFQDHFIILIFTSNDVYAYNQKKIIAQKAISLN